MSAREDESPLLSTSHPKFSDARFSTIATAFSLVAKRQVPVAHVMGAAHRSAIIPASQRGHSTYTEEDNLPAELKDQPCTLEVATTDRLEGRPSHRVSSTGHPLGRGRLLRLGRDSGAWRPVNAGSCESSRQNY